MPLTGVVLLLACSCASAASAQHCRDLGTAIVIDSQSHRLTLCERGSAAKEYAVALGRGGMGKRVEGDKKTPVGIYSLGEARPSERFGLFIPIGFPTPEQRAQGFSGGDVGIHGPDRKWRWAGKMNAWTDWTRGCVAVSQDAFIAEIAAWLAKSGSATLVHIR